jgi:hypothetical protein
MAIEPATEFHDFQGEYEGSIPFTRSSNFGYLSCAMISRSVSSAFGEAAVTE